MDGLIKEILEYKENNSFSQEECAKNLNVTVAKLKKILDGTTKLTSDEITRIHEIVKPKHKKGKKIAKILDLMFKLGATIMSLVVLLLCINGYTDVQTLIALLSIGVVCSSVSILPRIDK